MCFRRIPPYWFGVECQALNAAHKGPQLDCVPCLPTLVGVECQALNAARKGPPRTGYRRDVGRGYWCARRVYPPRIGLAWNARR